MADPDPLNQALEEATEALKRAEVALRHVCTPEREAVHREIVSAAASVGRAQCLRGAGR